MLFFLKNIVLFLFGKSLNGIVFAERERERERERETKRRYISSMCRVCLCSHVTRISKYIYGQGIVFIQCCGLFLFIRKQICVNN